MQATSISPTELATLVNRFVAELNKSASPAFFRVLEEAGLSASQVKLLHCLREADANPATIGSLADSLSLSLPATSRAIDGLVQRGYVERVACDSDRRQRLVSLLPAADGLLERLLAIRTSTATEFATALTDDERAELHGALSPIVDRLHGYGRSERQERS